MAMDFIIGDVKTGNLENSLSISADEFSERALGILEKDASGSFARIRDLAKSVFMIPHSFISMAPEGEEQLRIRMGDNVIEVPREGSFCGCVLDRSEILVVNDATKDDRFRDNPMVRDSMHARFYAGVPLVGSTVKPFGTICIMDTIPRDFGEKKLLILENLSKQIVQLLESEVRIQVLEERLDAGSSRLGSLDK